MKIKIFAVIIFLITAAVALLNEQHLMKTIDGYIARVEKLEIGETVTAETTEKMMDIYENFKKGERYLSITVNHEDLTSIEGLFSESIGYLTVEDANGAKVAKSRLVDALQHLRRLSGLNIDSVI